MPIPLTPDQISHQVLLQTRQTSMFESIQIDCQVLDNLFESI